MVTPEAVALEFRTANLGSRILAYLIDMVVVVAGILAGLFAVALLGQASDVVVPDWVALTIVLVLLPAWWLGYFIAFETLWRGRTLGKAALGLRVVTKEGAPVRFRHAAIRGLLGLVDFLVMGGFLAVVFILFSRDNQRLGDMVAGTLVLRERSALATPAPVSFAPPPGLEHYTATLDPSGVGTEEYQAVGRSCCGRPACRPVPARPWPCSWPTRWPPGCARRHRPGSPPSSTSSAWPPPTSSASAWPPAPVGLWTTPSAPFRVGYAPPPGGRARAGSVQGAAAPVAQERAGEGARPSPVEHRAGSPRRAELSIRCPRSRSAGSSPGRRSGCRSRCPWWPA